LSVTAESYWQHIGSDPPEKRHNRRSDVVRDTGIEPVTSSGRLRGGAASIASSRDPAMRTWMNAGRSYVPPVEIGEVMRALTIGRVIESRDPQFTVGEVVSAR
jgi:hypothetical protein